MMSIKSIVGLSCCIVSVVHATTTQWDTIYAITGSDADDCLYNSGASDDVDGRYQASTTATQCYYASLNLEAQVSGTVPDQVDGCPCVSNSECTAGSTCDYDTAGLTKSCGGVRRLTTMEPRILFDPSYCGCLETCNKSYPEDKRSCDKTDNLFDGCKKSNNRKPTTATACTDSSMPASMTTESFTQTVGTCHWHNGGLKRCITHCQTVEDECPGVFAVGLTTNEKLRYNKDRAAWAGKKAFNGNWDAAAYAASTAAAPYTGWTKFQGCRKLAFEELSQVESRDCNALCYALDNDNSSTTGENKYGAASCGALMADSTTQYVICDTLTTGTCGTNYADLANGQQSDLKHATLGRVAKSMRKNEAIDNCMTSTTISCTHNNKCSSNSCTDGVCDVATSFSYYQTKYAAYSE